MALYFSTSDPERLLTSFRDSIKSGRVQTWYCDEKGDFTHTAKLWERRAWLVPEIETGRLSFYILNPRNRLISSAVYAVYHGRFIESMLIHCDELFTDVSATSFPDTKDVVGPD
jgi:hypothetical protein